MPPVNSAESVQLMKDALGQPLQGAGNPLEKSITQATGLVWYDLRKPAELLYPWGALLTPLRNRLPRTSGEGGTAIHWKGVTGINTAAMFAGVSEGNRGGVVTTSTADYTVAYRGIGLEDNVTWEADYAGKNFEDVKALAALNLLRSTMLQEEYMLLGGNTTLALGTTPTPSLTTSTTGGSIGATVTVSVIAVALTFDGYTRSNAAGQVVQTFAKTNADGSSDTVNGGSAKASTNATIATGAGSTNSVTATVTAVAGASAYAWFAGTAGAEKFVSITTINKVVIQTLPGSGQAASALTATDYSQNALSIDGIMAYALNSANGGYYKSLDGATLTADGEGGIKEITAAFKFYWDTWRFGPQRMIIASQQVDDIRVKVTSGTGGTTILRMVQASGENGGIVGGTKVLGLLNPYTNEMVPFEVHPNAVPGVILFDRDELPYPAANVAATKEVVCRRDYYQIEWPYKTRKYEFGVYADEALRVKAPFVLGALCNIAAG